MSTYRRTNTRLLVIGLVVASLVTITLDFRGGDAGPLAIVGRATFAVISPLQKAVSAVFRPIGDFFTNLTRAGSLRAENERLRADVRDLLLERQEVLALEREVKELTDLLGLRERLDFETIGATVIAESPSNFEWSITVDRGSRDGVVDNMAVISAEGLVGRVVKVGPFSSTVMLIIDPKSAVTVRLASTGERGLLEGRRQRELRLALIDLQVPVAPGEPVTTSGYALPSNQSVLFPPDIPVGVVSQVLPDPAGLTRTVLVQPLVDFTRLEDVLLVMPPSGHPR